jgi:hypothetical protein
MQMWPGADDSASISASSGQGRPLPGNLIGNDDRLQLAVQRLSVIDPLQKLDAADGGRSMLLRPTPDVAQCAPKQPSWMPIGHTRIVAEVIDLSASVLWPDLQSPRGDSVLDRRGFISPLFRRCLGRLAAQARQAGRTYRLGLVHPGAQATAGMGLREFLMVPLRELGTPKAGTS